MFFFLQDSFKTIGKTFMKVTAMTTGEIEYTPIVIDNLNQTRKIPGRPAGVPLVPFEDSTYIFYYMFILVMPIALVNLLVSQTSLSYFCFKLDNTAQLKADDNKGLSFSGVLSLSLHVSLLARRPVSARSDHEYFYSP